MNSQIASRDNWDLATISQRAWMICNVLSSGTKDKIKKLLGAASNKDQIKLKVLHNAVVKCLNDYRKESTSSRLKDWQNAEEALETFVDELWQEHFPEKGSLPDALAVTNYLQDEGWRISKSTIYKHKKEGKIRSQPDGTFSINEVERDAIFSRRQADERLSLYVENAGVRQFILKNLTRDNRGRYLWRINIAGILNNIDNILRDIGGDTFDKPVLFVRGEKLNYIKNSDWMSIKKYFTQASLITIPGAGHWVH